MNQPTSEAASRSKVYRVIVGANLMDAAVYSPFSLLHSDDDDDALSCGLYHYILYNSQCYQTSSLLFVKNMSFGWSWRLEGNSGSRAEYRYGVPIESADAQTKLNQNSTMQTAKLETMCVGVCVTTCNVHVQRKQLITSPDTTHLHVTEEI